MSLAIDSAELSAVSTPAYLEPEITDARQIAAQAIATWRGIYDVLAAIIGEPGVAAVYGRSLFLTRASQACLIPAYDRLPTDDLFEPLQEALSLQTPADAVAANAALLQAFIGQLNNLIGGSLTQRLLDSMAPPTLQGVLTSP